MAPKRRVGGRAHSSSSSGIFFSADDQSEVQGNSTLSSSYGNSSNGNGHGCLGLVYGGNGAVLNIAGSSGPSIGASSLVTDANSGLSGGPRIGNNNNNTESYMRLPASPLSFSSNFRSVSGSPIMDGSPVVQQNQEPNSQLSNQSQQHQGPSQLGQVQLSNNRFAGSFTQDPTYNNNSQLQKKPRLDTKQEGGPRQNLLQPFLNGQDSLHLQNTHHHHQLQALIQQQKIHQQQEILRSMPPQQRTRLLEQHQMQLRQHQMQLRQHRYRRQGGLKQSFDSSVCSRLVLQYLRHQRQRPKENTFLHWKEFVAEYYAPQATQRWCFSLYNNNNNVGHHSPGVLPHVTLDATHCHLCGSKSGKGFVTTNETLPRLYDIKYASGLIDEFLFLDLPDEARSPSGEMILEYGKAVLESVYEKSRVVHEGKLRIVFSSNLKILSWEFCTHRHEEFIPRRLVAPQVNQLLEVVQKCQSTEKGPNAISHKNLQANCNMFVTIASQFASSVDLQSINDLGFSRRYAQSLQMSEIANGMTDLMDVCIDNKIGPIGVLKEFTRHDTGNNVATSQSQNMQKMHSCDEVKLSKFEQSHVALANYKQLIAASRNPMNSDHSGGGAPPQVAAPPPPPPPPSPPAVNGCNNPNQPPSSYNQEIGNNVETINMVGSRDGTETGLENDDNPVANNVGTSPNMNNSLKTESNQCLNNGGFNQEPVEPETAAKTEDDDFLDINIDDYIIFNFDD